MKRYIPTFVQRAGETETWYGMKEDDDGDWYSRADADTRIAELERALRSVTLVLVQMLDKHQALDRPGREALSEADKALAP